MYNIYVAFMYIHCTDGDWLFMGALMDSLGALFIYVVLIITVLPL